MQGNSVRSCGAAARSASLENVNGGSAVPAWAAEPPFIGEKCMELTDLRYTLAMDRIREIPGEHLVPAEYEQYFEDGAKWFLQMEEEERFLLSEETQTEDLTLLQERNRRLYEEILPENYGRSWANPEYASEAGSGGRTGPRGASL